MNASARNPASSLATSGPARGANPPSPARAIMKTAVAPEVAPRIAHNVPSQVPNRKPPAIVNTAPPGLVGYALADRADAIQLWEPAYTLLKTKKPSIQTLDTQINKTWTTFAGGERIPYLGVAAHSDWIEQNQAIIPRLYATYKEAADFIAKHPEEAAALITPKSTPQDRAALVSLIKANDRLGMNVVPAGEVAKQIDAVYKAGVDVGYFKSPPSTDTIYVKSMK